jgi:hypothetical protein
VTSKAKHPTQTIFSNAKEGEWVPHFGISGIRASGFRGFKYPNTAYNNPQILKATRCGIHCFGISGFGILKFTNTWRINTNEKENLKCEK